MKKVLALALAVLMCMGIFAGCAGGDDKDVSSKTGTDQSEATGDSDDKTDDLGSSLTIYTWEGMFPQEVLKGFENETGVKISYSNFDFNETMLAKLQNDTQGEYDLVICDDYIIETVIAEGLAEKLDKSKIPNFGNINPLYQAQYYDPQDEYTVPYGAGVQTIVYDPNLVDLDIKGYEDLWSEKLKDNLGLIASYLVIDGMALKTMGESYNTEDIATIEAAGEKLIELAPNVRLIKDDNLQDDIISGEIAAAVMYTSQVTMAKMVNPELKVVYPEEGLGFGIMGAFVPEGAKNSAAAHAFLDYILEPEVSAECFEYIGYYCTTKTAEEYISDEMKEYLTIPDDFDTSKMEMIRNLPAEVLEAHERIWTAFKAATD